MNILGTIILKPVSGPRKVTSHIEPNNLTTLILMPYGPTHKQQIYALWAYSQRIKISLMGLLAKINICLMGLLPKKIICLMGLLNKNMPYGPTQ